MNSGWIILTSIWQVGVSSDTAHFDVLVRCRSSGAGPFFLRGAGNIGYTHISKTWEVYEPPSPTQERVTLRREWLAEMARRFGVIPAPDAKYGISSLARIFLPDLFADAVPRTVRMHTGDRPHDRLAELGLFDYENAFRFDVGINSQGRVRRRTNNVHLPVLVDPAPKNRLRACYGDPKTARRRVHWRLPEGSTVTLVE